MDYDERKALDYEDKLDDIVDLINSTMYQNRKEIKKTLDKLIKLCKEYKKYLDE